MRERITILLVVSGAIFATLYFSRKSFQVENESTNRTKALSEKQLITLRKYEERFARNSYHLSRALESIMELENDDPSENLSEEALITLKILHHRSTIHLEEIIKSLKSYEEYPNLNQKELLDDAITMLEKVDDEILSNSLKSEDVYSAFNLTLNALAKAEVNIVESAVKSNQAELAKISLKQAQIHIKSAFLLDYSTQFDDGAHFDMELLVYRELDSLIMNDSLSIHQIDSRLSRISKELDSLIRGVKTVVVPNDPSK